MEHGTAQRHKKAVGRLPLQTVKQPKTAESGQTLVEFALMLPFMLLLLLGIVEIGRVAFIRLVFLLKRRVRRISVNAIPDRELPAWSAPATPRLLARDLSAAVQSS